MKTETDLVQKQEAIFCLLAKFGEALSSSKRLKMIGLLGHGPKSVDQLARMTGQSLAATSAHLKVLRASSLVVSEKAGRLVWCRLAGENVARLWITLRNLGAELMPEVREIIQDCFGDPELLSALTMGELREELRHDHVILLDVRDRDEFQAGHLPKALYIPAADVESRVKEFSDGRPVLVYCRGPYCGAALTAATILRSHGVNARRLPFSVPEWRAAGLPIAAS